jgi:hypothetical protein
MAQQNSYWLKFLSSETDLTKEGSFVYQNTVFRRKISLQNPFENILKDEWIFVSIKNLKINTTYEGNSIPQNDDHCYVVAYQPLNILKDITDEKNILTKTKIYRR